MKNIVITISRQYGSGGKTIGRHAGERTGGKLLQQGDPSYGFRGQRVNERLFGMVLMRKSGRPGGSVF